MATKFAWIVFLDRDQLAVARFEGGSLDRSDTSSFDRQQPTETAESISRLLEERGHAGQPILLALGSSDVVSTTVALPARKSLKRTALAFFVEPNLPWSVEESVIDYQRAGDRIFVVAAEASPLRELIVALQERGLVVASVSPLARLALEFHLERNSSLTCRYALVWGNPDATIDLWLIENDQPVLWRWLPQQLPAVARALKQIPLVEGLILAGRNLPDGFLTSLSELSGVPTCKVPAIDAEDPLACGARYAAAILGGKRDAPIELCRDALAPSDRHRSIRRELRILQISLGLLMVVVGLAAGLKAEREEALRAKCATREAALFQDLFPKERVPVAVNTRLQSEVMRLKGLRGESTDLPQLTPYLSLLERLFRSLPESLRFRVLDIRIDNGRLYVVGQARAHGDADRIADGLRAAGLEVASPTTHRLEREGVEFRISARLSPPPTKSPLRRPA